MKLPVPSRAPALHLVDIYGKPIAFGTTGRRTLLSFFRDAACPFCNYRIYELTRHHKRLATLGLDIVAVFASSREEIMRFVARQPRPFPVAAEPTLTAYRIYGIERSLWRKIRAILFRIPTLIKGLRIVGVAGLNTNNLMPADFLIDERGNIVETHYGRDAGDRISFDRIDRFLERGQKQRQKEMDRTVPSAKLDAVAPRVGAQGGN